MHVFSVAWRGSRRICGRAAGRYVAQDRSTSGHGFARGWFNCEASCVLSLTNLDNRPLPSRWTTACRRERFREQYQQATQQSHASVLIRDQQAGASIRRKRSRFKCCVSSDTRGCLDCSLTSSARSPQGGRRRGRIRARQGSAWLRRGAPRLQTCEEEENTMRRC